VSRLEHVRLGGGEEGYSHELSSCGFWPGGGDEGAFYAYAYPCAPPTPRPPTAANRTGPPSRQIQPGGTTAAEKETCRPTNRTESGSTMKEFIAGVEIPDRVMIRTCGWPLAR